MGRILFKNLFFFFWIFVISHESLGAAADTVSFLDHTTRNYDQIHIKLKLNFDFHESTVLGEEDFTFSPLVNNFNELVLHAKTMDVHSVTLGGLELEKRQDKNHLRIKFNRDFNSGEEITVKIKYTARPSKGLYFFKPLNEAENMPYQIWTQGQSNFNRHWFPAYDLPDDKRTSEIFATVQENFTVISNGILAEVKDNEKGEKIYHWKMEQPFSNYLTSIIVGEYTTIKENVRGTLLEYNIEKEWVDKKEYFYGNTPEMLNFFSDYLVEYPYERYAQTAVQDFSWGGMENITSTTLNKRIYHDEKAVPNYSAGELIAHEFAHQWFGDLVTCGTWEHIWLNEGITTYMTNLWIKHEQGEDEFKYLRYKENQEYFNALENEPLGGVKLRIEEKIPAELQGGKAYDKGAAVLNMLRFEIGDKAFQKGLQKYLTVFKDSTAVTEDLRIIMENVSEKNLEQFFEQWIYKAGFPVFKVSYKWDADNKEVLLSVNQIQEMLPSTGIFKVPIVVEIINGKNSIVDTILINNKQEQIKIKSQIKPELVKFNKDNLILCKVFFEKDFEELTYQLHYDTDIIGRITAAGEIKKYGTKSVSELARAIKRDKFYAVRIKAAESLKEIKGKEALEALKYGSNDPDARVREASLKSFAAFDKGEVTDILKEKLFNDSNDYVKGAAAYALGAVKADSTLSILQEVLNWNSHRNIIRRGIFEGLTSYGDPAVLEWVREYTKYKYSNGGMHLQDIAALDCAKELAKKDYERSIDVIAAALENPYFRTRNHAAKLLKELKAEETLTLLRQVYENENRLIVKDPLRKIINSFTE